MTELVSYGHRASAIKHLRQVHTSHCGSTSDHIGYDKSSTEGQANDVPLMDKKSPSDKTEENKNPPDSIKEQANNVLLMDSCIFCFLGNDRAVTELISYGHRAPAIEQFRQIHTSYCGPASDVPPMEKKNFSNPTEGTMVIQPEPPPRDGIRTLHDVADNVKKLATASSACSDKMSQVVKSNFIIQFNKVSNLTNLSPTVEIGLETSQHTAPNWAESIKKVSASDCNQAKMDPAIEWMQQNLEETRTESEHSASNQAGLEKKMAFIKSNQAKMCEILSSLQIDKVNMQSRLEEFQKNITSLIHDGAAKNLTNPTPDYGAADLAKNGDRPHNAAARNMITPKFYDAAARNMSTPTFYNAPANSLKRFNSRFHNGAAGNSSLRQETLSPKKGGKKGNNIKPLPSSKLSSTNAKVDTTVAVHLSLIHI